MGNIDIQKYDDVISVRVSRRYKGMHVYLYLVDGMLIDTGPPYVEKQLGEIFTRDDFDFELSVLTHYHEDHSGTARWIQDHKHLPIYMHSNGIQICEKPADYPEYREKAWGLRKAFTPKPLTNQIRSRNTIWEVVHTPGHSDDHVCFYDKKNKRLFTGDLYVMPIVNVIMKTESMPEMRNSLQRILTYDFDILYCSHSGIIENGKEKVKLKLDHINNLYENVEKLYYKGYTISEINRELFKQEFRIIKDSNGEYDSIHIVRSIVEDLTNMKALSN